MFPPQKHIFILFTAVSAVSLLCIFLLSGGSADALADTGNTVNGTGSNQAVRERRASPVVIEAGFEAEGDQDITDEDFIAEEDTSPPPADAISFRFNQNRFGVWVLVFYDLNGLTMMRKELPARASLSEYIPSEPDLFEPSDTQFSGGEEAPSASSEEKTDTQKSSDATAEKKSDVINSAPSILAVSSPTLQVEGESGVWKVQVRDKDDTKLRVSIEWGSGVPSLADVELSKEGDGVATILKVFDLPGNYTASITATDSKGGTARLQKTIRVLESGSNQPLGISCGASPTLSYVGGTVVWTSKAGGGDGRYRYTWSGTDNLSGTASSITKAYASLGVKRAILTVSSGAQTKAVSCGSVSVEGQANAGAGQASPIKADLHINGGNGPIQTTVGASLTLDWNAPNAFYCTGNWTVEILGAKGETKIVADTSNDYYLTCYDGTKTFQSQDSVSVFVTEAPTSNASLLWSSIFEGFRALRH